MKQSGGQGSVNLQGQTVSVHVGITAVEAAELMLSVGRSNLVEMQGLAKQIVDERLESFTDRFVQSVEARAPGVLQAVQDPDVQYTLFAAQRDYARSGAENLGETLIDLLVARCAEKTGSLRAIVLNEAVTTVGRLTPGQVNALTCFWLVTRVRGLSMQNLDGLVNWLRTNVVPATADLPSHSAAYEHLSYCGCAQIQVTAISLGDAWAKTYPGLFARGMTREEIPEDLRDVSALFTQCLTDPEKLQVNALDADAAVMTATQAGFPERSEVLSQLLLNNVKAADVVEAQVIGLIPELAGLADLWTSTPMQNLGLSSVGIALAHANWTRLAGKSTGLDVWIPDGA